MNDGYQVQEYFETLVGIFMSVKYGSHYDNEKALVRVCLIVLDFASVFRSPISLTLPLLTLTSPSLSLCLISCRNKSYLLSTRSGRRRGYSVSYAKWLVDMPKLKAISLLKEWSPRSEWSHARSITLLLPTKSWHTTKEYNSNLR